VTLNDRSATSNFIASSEARHVEVNEARPILSAAKNNPESVDSSDIQIVHEFAEWVISRYSTSNVSKMVQMV